MKKPKHLPNVASAQPNDPQASPPATGAAAATLPGVQRSKPAKAKRFICGTTAAQRRVLAQDPGYAAARAEIESHARAQRQVPQRDGVTRIPVVVNVVWKTPEQNISDAQIASQMAVLNRDYRRANPDVASTPEPFMRFVADARIEFALATVDPDGAPTSGIRRRQTTKPSFRMEKEGVIEGVKFTSQGGLDAWPADRYLNLWVCRLAGGLSGYAQPLGFPAAIDGVVIDYTAFGTIGTATAPFNLGRTATHEIGHWLNLSHLWEEGEDEVSDTPVQAEPNYRSPSFPHVSGDNGPHGDMFMNFMDYTDDQCKVMFTEGQVARMQACLDGPRARLAAAAPPAAASA